MWTAIELCREFYRLRYTEKSGEKPSFKNDITVIDRASARQDLGDLMVPDGVRLRSRLSVEPTWNVLASVTLRVFRLSWQIIHRKIGLDKLFPEQYEYRVHRQS